MDNYTIPITKPASNVSQPKQETTYPSEVVDLPSQGHFYDSSSPLSNGTINLKVMTAKEEDILTNQNYIKKGIVLDKLIESIIVDKDIKLDDLLLGDKNAVFVATRRFAYGDNYGPLQIKCPSCRENNECVFNLGELKYKNVDLSKYEFYSYDTVSDIESDYLISNYGFSECFKIVQDVYLDKLINKTKNFYMIINLGDGVYTPEELKEKIKGPINIIPEAPISCDTNLLFYR